MFSVIKDGFCSKLTTEFDSRFRQLQGIEQQLNTALNALKIDIASATGFSPHSAIRQFERDVAANVDKLIPDLKQFDQLIDLVNQCVLTKNDPMFSKPSIMAKRIEDTVKSNANTFLTNLAASIPTELSLSQLIKNMKGLTKTSKLNLVIPESYQALACMTAICGTDITSRLLQLEGFLNKYTISATGDFLDEVLMAAEGMAVPYIQSVTRVVTQFEDVESQIEEAFVSGIDRLKDLVPDSDDDE